MTITLSDQTRMLVELRMKEFGISDPEALLQTAVRNLKPADVVDYDDLDPEIRAAIEAGEEEYRQGLARPWEEVRKELQARFVRR